MNGWLLRLSSLFSLVLLLNARAADLQLSRQGTSTLLRVEDDPDNDWLIQLSTNLATWNNVPGLTPVIAGRTNSPTRTVGTTTGAQQFYRALKTAGLYDPSLFRTVSLTFTQANWGTLLTTARTTGSNVYCPLITLDNGATNAGAGVRYRGAPVVGNVSGASVYGKAETLVNVLLRKSVPIFGRPVRFQANFDNILNVNDPILVNADAGGQYRWLYPNPFRWSLSATTKF